LPLHVAVASAAARKCHLAVLTPPQAAQPFPQVAVRKMLARLRSRRPRRPATGGARSCQQPTVQARELFDDGRPPRPTDHHERPVAISNGVCASTVVIRTANRELHRRHCRAQARSVCAVERTRPSHSAPDHQAQEHHGDNGVPEERASSRSPRSRRRRPLALTRDAQPRKPYARPPPSPHLYHSPNVHTGPQPPERCRSLAKCAAISRQRWASSDLVVLRHRTGAAPAASSSQRGQPGVFCPNTGPPQVCLVVAIFASIAYGSTILQAPSRS